MISEKANQENRIQEGVTEYLSQKKHWQPNEYRLEYKGMTDNGKFYVVWAIYLDDEVHPKPGSGRSVSLQLDPKEYRVVSELRWQ